MSPSPSPQPLRIALAALSLGCAAPPQPTAPTPPPAAVEAAPAPVAAAPETWPLKAPDPSTIPEGPLGEAIQRGLTLVSHTPEALPDHVGNGLRCTSCHLQGGTVAKAGPWVGIAAVFPEYRTRNAAVNSLQDRVNDCFERSLNGRALPADSADMNAIIAYMTWLSQGVPMGTSVEGRGFPKITDPPTPDPAQGEALFGQKCAVCHGADGQGQTTPDGGYLYPALWGDRSFNIGAGLARLNTAAAFVRWNMPLGQGGTLTDQEALDLAAYFTAQPRPDFAGKAQDWPQGGKPSDARY